jgi:hypothetical protein
MTLGDYDKYWDEQEELMTQGYAEYKAAKDKEKAEGKGSNVMDKVRSQAPEDIGMRDKVNAAWDNSAIKGMFQQIGLVNPSAVKQNTMTNNVNITVNGVTDPDKAAQKTKSLFEQAYYEKFMGER